MIICCRGSQNRGYVAKAQVCLRVSDLVRCCMLVMSDLETASQPSIIASLFTESSTLFRQFSLPFPAKTVASKARSHFPRSVMNMVVLAYGGETQVPSAPAVGLWMTLCAMNRVLGLSCLIC